MEGNQDIIKIKSSKKSPEDLSIQKKRKKEKLEAKKKRDQITQKESEQSSAESVSGNLDEITAGSEEKTKGIDSKVREVASDPENQEVDEEIKRAGEDTKAQMREAGDWSKKNIEEIAEELIKSSLGKDVFKREETGSKQPMGISKSDKEPQDTKTLTKKEEILILNQEKAMEILEEIGLLEIKKNNREEPDEPAEEAKKASELARAIENSKYIKEQEQLLTKLSGMHESYKSAVYGNESNKIISEIHKLSRQDENNGKQYRDKVNSIIQSENVEKVNNGLKQLLKELKAKQGSEELNVAEKTEEKLPQKGAADGLKQESKVEKEKVYEIIDERYKEMELKEGDQIYIDGAGPYQFVKLTVEGAGHYEHKYMTIDIKGDSRCFHPEIHVITETREKYNEWKKKFKESSRRTGQLFEVKRLFSDKIYKLNQKHYEIFEELKEGVTNLTVQDGEITSVSVDFNQFFSKEKAVEYLTKLVDNPASKQLIIDFYKKHSDIKIKNGAIISFESLIEEGDDIPKDSLDENLESLSLPNATKLPDWIAQEELKNVRYLFIPCVVGDLPDTINKAKIKDLIFKGNAELYPDFTADDLEVADLVNNLNVLVRKDGNWLNQEGEPAGAGEEIALRLEEGKGLAWGVPPEVTEEEIEPETEPDIKKEKQIEKLTIQELLTQKEKLDKEEFEGSEYEEEKKKYDPFYKIVNARAAQVEGALSNFQIVYDIRVQETVPDPNNPGEEITRKELIGFKNTHDLLRFKQLLDENKIDDYDITIWYFPDRKTGYLNKSGSWQTLGKDFDPIIEEIKNGKYFDLYAAAVKRGDIKKIEPSKEQKEPIEREADEIKTLHEKNYKISMGADKLAAKKGSRYRYNNNRRTVKIIQSEKKNDLEDAKRVNKELRQLLQKLEDEIGEDEEVINLTDEIKKEDVWIIELSEDKAEQETIKKLFEYILERARKVDVYEGLNENALKRIVIDQTKESYNKYK
ncbi:hypothetical protein KAU19_03880 [Candidatus Parcubacteria bacterium]|nr:hypothetical protein [Candidatus Parcubacteria bacterium]